MERREIIVKKLLEGCEEDAISKGLDVPASTVRTVRGRYFTKDATGKWTLKREKDLSDRIGLSHEESVSLLVDRFMPYYHAAQKKLIRDLVVASMEARRLRPSDISKALAAERDIRVASALQRVTAFMGNDKIANGPVYRNLFQSFTCDSSTVVVAMDWTEFAGNNQITLQAFLLLEKNQGIPVVCHTVPRSSVGSKASEAGKRAVYRLVLSRLNEMVQQSPTVRRVIILGDREFGSVPFMQACDDFGFCYCLRKRGPSKLYRSSRAGSPRLVTNSVRQGSPPVKHSGLLCTAQHYVVKTTVFAWAMGMKEKWTLLSNLEDIRTRVFILLYARRWAIETNFKADKDENFGLGLGYTNLYGATTAACERRDKLWLIATLVGVYSLCLGKASQVLTFDRVFLTYSKEHQKQHPQLSTRSTGKEMHRWWARQVNREARGRLPAKRRRQLRTRQRTRLQRGPQGYMLRHGNETIEVFEFAIHIARAGGRYLAIDFESFLRSHPPAGVG
jgi:hypothetical protein